jgi:ribonuclease HII
VIQHPEGLLGAGVDEAGRGPLAGPVVAAAVILDPARPIAGLADSKSLAPARRSELAGLIRERALAWGIGVASHAEIDRLNILQATLLAMRRAILALDPAPLLLEVDGNRLPRLEGLPCRDNAVAIVRGDALRPAIGAASILAKTVRDSLMHQLDARYPGYGFSIHKGYPTAAHLEALASLGPSAVHRLSFGPVRSARSIPIESPARR